MTRKVQKEKWGSKILVELQKWGINAVVVQEGWKRVTFLSLRVWEVYL